MTRRELANALKDAAESYFSYKRYSCFQELSVLPWGRLRADLLALNLRAHIVLCEVKSCPSDYYTDTKWMKYLGYCDNMYFVTTQETFRKIKLDLVRNSREQGVGTLVIGNDGYLHSALRSTFTPIDNELRTSLITRMAWRSGTSKRTRRRTRHYV